MRGCGRRGIGNAEYRWCRVAATAKYFFIVGGWRPSIELNITSGYSPENMYEYEHIIARYQVYAVIPHFSYRQPVPDPAVKSEKRASN